MKAFVLAAFVAVSHTIGYAQTTQLPSPPGQSEAQEIGPSSKWGNAEWHQAFAGWASAVLSAATLIVVWRQLHGLNKQLKSSALQGIWSAWIDIDKWFAEDDHAKFRRFYYPARTTSPEGDDHGRIDAVSEMLLDCYAHMYAQQSVLGADFNRLGSYMQSVYREQPVFKNFVDYAAKWYDPAFISFLKAGPRHDVPPPPKLSGQGGASAPGTTQ